MVGVDHPGDEAGFFQPGVDALPVDAGTFQDDEFDTHLAQPRGQSLEVALEAAEFAGVSSDVSGCVLAEDGEDVLHPMHVDAGDPLVQSFQLRFHEPSPKLTVGVGSWRTARAVLPRVGIRRVPLYRASCAQGAWNIRGYGLFGPGPVRRRGTTAKRFSTSRPPTPPFYVAQSPQFLAPLSFSGASQGIMTG